MAAFAVSVPYFFESECVLLDRRQAKQPFFLLLSCVGSKQPIDGLEQNALVKFTFDYVGIGSSGCTALFVFTGI
jgi:hypothetical protein